MAICRASCVGNVLARWGAPKAVPFGLAPGSVGAWMLLTLVGIIDGDGRLRLRGAAELCLFLSFSGRFLNRHYCEKVSSSALQLREIYDAKQHTLRLWEHLSAAILFFARPANVFFPSRASLSTPSFAVGESGFSRTKKMRDRIAKYVVYMVNQKEPLRKPLLYIPAVMCTTFRETLTQAAAQA